MSWLQADGVCRFLSDDDDGVSEAIVPFAVQYIGLLKVGVANAPPQH